MILNIIINILFNSQMYILLLDL